MRLLLSGGGFRATLFHLGVLRLLHDQKALSHIDEIYAVSGGSILAAHLACHWPRYITSAKTFDEAAEEIIQFTKRDLRGRVLLTHACYWLTLLLIPTIACYLALLIAAFFGSAFRLSPVWISRLVWLSMFAAIGLALLRWDSWHLISLLSKEYEALYEGATVSVLAAQNDYKPKTFLLATNLTTGRLAYFYHQGVALNVADSQDPASSQTEINDAERDVTVLDETIPLSMAVAASSAFPPAFSPVPISEQSVSADASKLPTPHFLADGGVYDNMGIRPMHLICAREKLTPADRSLVILSNAERRFDWVVKDTFTLLPSRAIRTSDILMKRVSTLEIRGRDNINSISLEADLHSDLLSTPLQQGVRNIRTDLDAFSDLEIQLLGYKGYCAAYQALMQKQLDIADVHKENGVPLHAASTWLPIKHLDSRLVRDPLRAIKRSQTPGLRFAVMRSGEGLFVLALAILTISLIASWKLIPDTIKQQATLARFPRASLPLPDAHFSSEIENELSEGELWMSRGMELIPEEESINAPFPARKVNIVVKTSIEGSYQKTDLKLVTNDRCKMSPLAVAYLVYERQGHEQSRIITLDSQLIDPTRHPQLSIEEVPLIGPTTLTVLVSALVDKSITDANQCGFQFLVTH